LSDNQPTTGRADPAPHSNLGFFRQTGWMVVATTFGGGLMYLVHVPAAARLSEAEYGVFLTLLQVMNLMLIPAMGLQTIIAQQTASALTAAQHRQLAATIRVLLLGVSVIWLVMALATWVWQNRLLTSLQIANPAALWVTVVIGLAMLGWPILQGVLQGEQNFLWLGILQTLNGGGRFLGVLVIVLLLGGQAAGAMTAALLGYWVTVSVAAWLTRREWLGTGEAVDWHVWLRRVVPLTLGLAATQFTMAADMILAQTTFNRDVTALYGAAGTIGRGLIFFTGAVFAVMFPKAVASKARGKRTDVLAAALGATAVLGMCAALACTVIPGLPLRMIYPSKPEYWQMAPLVPWFAWCMLPLSLANVLIGHLLARERFEAVPWLLVVAVGYGVTLWARQDAFRAAEQATGFRMVVMTLGFFSLLLLAVAAWFTWWKGHKPLSAEAATH
jgi:O-antigen/teichoic acid export membrane protein